MLLFLEDYIIYEDYCIYHHFYDNTVLKSLYLNKYGIDWCLKLSDISGRNGIGYMSGYYVIDDLYYIIFDICDNNNILSIFSPDSFYNHNYSSIKSRNLDIKQKDYESCVFGITNDEISRYNFIDFEESKYIQYLYKLRTCIFKMLKKNKNINLINIIGISLGATNCYFILIELLDILCNNLNILTNLNEINLKAIATPGVSQLIASMLEKKIFQILKLRKNLKINFYTVTGYNDKIILPGVFVFPNIDDLYNIQQSLVVIVPNKKLFEDPHGYPLCAARLCFNYRIYDGAKKINKYLEEILSIFKYKKSNGTKKDAKKLFYQNNNYLFKLSFLDLLNFNKLINLFENISDLYSIYYQDYCQNVILQNNILLLNNYLQELHSKKIINDNQLIEIQYTQEKLEKDKIYQICIFLINYHVNILNFIYLILRISLFILLFPYYFLIYFFNKLKIIYISLMIIISNIINLFKCIFFYIFIYKTKKLIKLIDEIEILNKIICLIREKNLN